MVRRRTEATVQPDVWDGPTFGQLNGGSRNRSQVDRTHDVPRADTRLVRRTDDYPQRSGDNLKLGWSHANRISVGMHWQRSPAPLGDTHGPHLKNARLWWWWQRSPAGDENQVQEHTRDARVAENDHVQ